MTNDDLIALRQKLDNLIENEAEASQILEVSLELDKLIEEFMEKLRNN